MTAQVSLRKVAALTMLRNDRFFLQKWVEYYGGQLGREHLYIYFDGEDQEVPEFCGGCYVRRCHHILGSVVSMDKRRASFLSDEAAVLFARGYEIVIGTDADEFVIPDPESGAGLREFLSRQTESHPGYFSISPIGLDVGQRLGEEGDINLDSPFLSQRSYAQIGPRYTKAAVMFKPCRWGSGFHRIKRHNFHICRNLYLFHFGYCDQARLSVRFSDKDRIMQGQNRHMWKRSRVIKYCSEKHPVEFRTGIMAANIIERCFRPVYAWNKPSMIELKIVVRIPERFSTIV